MKTIDLIPLLDQDPLGSFFSDCWAAGIDYSQATEEIKHIESLKEYVFSKKMYDLIISLLDEGMDLEFECAQYSKKVEEGQNE